MCLGIHLSELCDFFYLFFSFPFVLVLSFLLFSGDICLLE
jgi:hypothetical protein